MSNTISFVGTVSMDAEVRYTTGGTAILSVNVANNVGYGENKKTNWFRVSLFGKRAEGKIVEWLKKGQQVFVSGELTINEYTNKDGLKAQSIEINANVLDLVGRRTEQNTDNRPVSGTGANNPAPYNSFYDDIPF